jgi:hypothetical protein
MVEHSPSYPEMAEPVAYRWISNEGDIRWSFGAYAPSNAFKTEPLYAAPQPLGVAQASAHPLQEIYDAVNALGGRSDQDNSYDQGIVDTVSKVLEIIETKREVRDAQFAVMHQALKDIADLKPVLLPSQLVDRFIEVRVKARSALPTPSVPSTSRCTCAALGKHNIPHARNCPAISSTNQGGK